MYITYTPREGEKREWEYDPNDMLSLEAEAIERVTGWTYEEFGEQFMKGSTLAKHAMLWVLLRRDNRALKFGDVTFRLSEFQARLDAVEIDKLEAAIANEDLTEDERAEFDAMLAASREALEEGKEQEETPKAKPGRKSASSD